MKAPLHHRTPSTRTAPLRFAAAALTVLAVCGLVLAGRAAAGQQPESAHVVPAPPSQQAPAPPPPVAQQQEPAAPPPPPQESAPPPAQQPAPAPPPQEQQPAPPQQQLAAPAPSSAPASPPAAPRRAPVPSSPPPAPASAGRPAAPSLQAPLFGEQIEVRVVNVEAVVTDKSGNRVPDLTVKDFRLKVDGKPVKIEFFNEVRGGQAIAIEPGSVEESVPGLPDLAPGSPVGTSYLVFIDDFFSLAPHRNLVLKSLKEELTRLGPEDRMALVAFDGSHLKMLSSWSSSVRDLGRAIDVELGNPAYGLNREAELRNFRVTEPRGGAQADVLDRSRAGFQRTSLSGSEFAYVDQLANEVERVVHAAVGTLRGFATPPGRKVMLLLSGGWPFSVADYAVNDINRPVMEKSVPSGDELLRPLVETANRLGYTLYPVDVPGIETPAASAATEGPLSQSTLFGLREQEHEGTLVYLAKETGGRALLNSLRISSLSHVEADTRSYYWLGFTPSWQGNDKRHSIQLDVLRPGLSVRTRDSFLDRSRKAEVSMMVESAMLFGNQPGAVQMPVELGQPVKTRRGEIEVPLTLAIPTEAFTSVQLNGKYATEVELRVAAQDEHGDRSDIPVVPLQLQSDHAPLPGHFVRFQTKLKLRRTKQHLIFAIFDPLSNKITTAEADLKPD